MTRTIGILIKSIEQFLACAKRGSYLNRNMLQAKQVNPVVRLLKLFPCLAVASAIALSIDAHRMPADSAEMTPVRAAYIPVVTWLPAWIAKDKGFFERK